MDPFRLLAIAAIILGMVLVLAAAVFWFLTGKQSAVIMGAGVSMAIGGGLRNLLASLVSQIPEYIPPPTEIPEISEEPKPHPTTRPHYRESK